MPGFVIVSYTAAEAVTAGLAALLAVLLGVIGYRTWKASRVTPEEREKARRALLVHTGKMGDATLVEVHDTVLLYSYDVRGVEYTASQEVTVLKHLLPQDLSNLGPVSVKYEARNPANSIVVAESWSGLRVNVSRGTAVTVPVSKELPDPNV